MESAGIHNTQEVHSTMMNNAMLNPNYRQWLARRLSHEGRFRVVFGNYPECPEVFEFIDHPGNSERPVRYINMDARPGANISRFLDP